MGLGAGFVPSSTRKRIIEGKMVVNSLKLTEKAKIRPFGDTECLLRRHYAFSNRESSMIAKVINKQLIRSGYAAYLPATQGKGLLDDSHGTSPVSDGAATPEAVGGRDRLKPEGRVLTLVTRVHLPGLATPAAIEDGVWAKSDNVLQQYGAFSEDRLVTMP